NLGWLNYEKGEYIEARKWLELSVSADEMRADSSCLLALTLLQIGSASSDINISCLSLAAPSNQPEIEEWKKELISRL
ncbi:MAG: hypothetical protein AAFN93_29560, partial [Bacteroidota bacterium]